MGVVAADFDGNGYPDLYVANDSDPNHLWLNQGDGTFSEEAMLQGVAFNQFGVGEAGMGLALDDPDGDGDFDLFVSHLIEETNTFYENLGPLGFEDRSAQVGLGVASVPYTGFGTVFADLDNDGDLDLVVVNGAVKRRGEALRVSAGEGSLRFWDDYVEPNAVFESLGDSWHPAALEVDDFAGVHEISRGVLAFDQDGDGDLDLLVTNIEGPARLYRNESPRSGPLADRERRRACAFAAGCGLRCEHRHRRSHVHAAGCASGRLPDQRPRARAPGAR